MSHVWEFQKHTMQGLYGLEKKAKIWGTILQGGHKNDISHNQPCLSMNHGQMTVLLKLRSFFQAMIRLKQLQNKTEYQTWPTQCCTGLFHFTHGSCLILRFSLIELVCCYRKQSRQEMHISHDISLKSGWFTLEMVPFCWRAADTNCGAKIIMHCGH